MDDNKLNLIKNFINGKLYIKELTDTNNNYKFYINAIEELEKQFLEKLDYKSILEKITNSVYLDKYLYLMKNLESNILYKSYIHGINHNIRVSLLALIISMYEKIPLKDFELIIEATKYHDIGRTNDSEDKEHGFKSSQIIEFLKDTYGENEMNYLKTIIQCHSLNDDLFYEIAVKNNIDDIERCRKMFNVLKDADGLDRVRLEWPLIKFELIRTQTAKKLIPFAYELFECYNLGVDNE